MMYTVIHTYHLYPSIAPRKKKDIYIYLNNPNLIYNIQVNQKLKKKLFDFYWFFSLNENHSDKIMNLSIKPFVSVHMRVDLSGQEFLRNIFF